MREREHIFKDGLSQIYPLLIGRKNHTCFITTVYYESSVAAILYAVAINNKI